ncbi:hypothetical protein BC829DRAFT_48881 [Chytridium lagenaria]|nr:hypothetical protein BC829DRAFT_48881 [Chytridium lagenaria]
MESHTSTSSSESSSSPATTSSKACSTVFQWRITNFKLKIDKDKFKSEDNPSLISPRFGLQGWMWELRLHPRGDGPDNSGHISIYLAAVRSERETAIDRNESRGADSRHAGTATTWTRAVKYTISIPRTRPADGTDVGNVYSGTSSNVFESSVALSWGWKKYLDRSRLEEALQNDGSLLLNVEVKGECPQGLLMVDYDALNVSTLDEKDCAGSRSLLLNPLLADLELRIHPLQDSDKPSTNHVSLHAHRQILALRSEYWRVMFSSGMRESSSYNIIPFHRQILHLIPRRLPASISIVRDRHSGRM